MARTGDPPAVGAAASAEPDRDAAGELATGDPAVILGRLPKDAQLLLRDYIAGLAAEAGSARAAAARSEQVRKIETDILLGKLAAARAERDDALRTIAESTEQFTLSQAGFHLRLPGR